MKDLGERIKSLREDFDMKQEDLADILNINRSSLANYESNRRTPSVEIIVQIANFFKVSTDYLLGRTKIKEFSVSEFDLNNKYISINQLGCKTLKDAKEILDLIKLLNDNNIKFNVSKVNAGEN